MSQRAVKILLLSWEYSQGRSLSLTPSLPPFLSLPSFGLLLLCPQPLLLSSLHYPLTTPIPQPSEDTVVIYKACCVSPGGQIPLDSISHHEAIVQSS